MRGLIVDNFAGGGGASTGIEAALGRAVDIAINHDAEAVAMHIANHPATKHYCQSIWSVDCRDACTIDGELMKVDLAWFSPDCKHHSKAKGGKPREKNIRDLAWIVVEWIERLQEEWKRRGHDPKSAIRVIALENVEEFRKWGPLDELGMPIKGREGEEFDLFVRRIKRRGAKVEYRELVAYEYGDPTIRKRLYMLIRFDGLPIIWPEPTHGKPGSPEVLSGKRQPWRTAAECINWSIPCPSIFDRKKDLAEATNRRIAHGVMRYVVNAALNSGCPFIVPVTHTGDLRTHDCLDPLRTITTANGGELTAVDIEIAPHITKFRGGAIGSDIEAPMPTVTANGEPARPAGAIPLGLIGDTLVGVGGRRGQSPAMAVDGTYPTTTTKADAAVATANMVPLIDRQFSQSMPRPVDEPIGSTTAGGGGKSAMISAFLSRYYGSDKANAGGDPEGQIPTVRAGGTHHAVVCAHLEQANGGPRNKNSAGSDVRHPLSTATTTGSQQRVVQTTLLEEGDLPPEMMERATRVAAFLIKYYGAAQHGQPVDEPLHSVTALPRFAVVTVTIDATTYVIVDIGMRMLTPRELARAQGFPDTYILDPIGPSGRTLSKSAQIRMIGNSVCPGVAAALVRANMADEIAEREVEAA